MSKNPPPTALADTDLWMRSRGLPWLVGPCRGGTLLVGRTAPFLLVMNCLQVVRWMLQGTIVPIDSRAPVLGFVVLGMTVLAVTLLIAIPISALVLAVRWLRTWPRSMTTVGWMLITYSVGIAPWVSGHPFAPSEYATDGLSVCAALLATRLGIGSLASWTARSAVRQLGALPRLASRALPLLMLVVVVSFFSRNLWEVTNAMTSARLAGVVAIFALLGLLFIVPVTRTETVGLDSPFGAAPALNRLEHLNVSVVLVLAQGLQVAIFSGLVCAFFVGLGSVAFTPAVLDGWLGADRRPLELLGVQLPVDAALVKTAVFLSCISSLNFLISATTTANYRSAFYDPLVDDVRKALAVRAEYRRSAPSETGPKIVAERE